MKRINVLQIISALRTTSGGEKYLFYLAKNLNRERYKVFVAYSHHSKLIEELRAMEAEVVIIDMMNKFRLKAIYDLARFIKSKDIHIVHTHGVRADFFGRLAARMAGAPIVISLRHNSINDYSVNWLTKKIYIIIDRLTTPFTDKIIAVAEALAKDLIHISKIKPEKVIAIPNGVDLKEFDPKIDGEKIRKEFGIPVQSPVVGIIGRMYWEKGQEYFIRAIPKIIESVSEAKFLIVGDGPLRSKLEHLARQLKISEHCIFTGLRMDAPEIIAIFGIGVLSSIKEGFPFTILEYMAMAKPVVATSICGNPEAVENGKTGILIPARDPQALANAAIDLLQNKAKAQHMGQAGRLLVEQKFNAERMVRDIERVYEDLIEKSDRL